LADILPDLIELAKDAVATTKEQQAKKEILATTKEVIDAAKKMIERFGKKRVFFLVSLYCENERANKQTMTVLNISIYNKYEAS
jgi:negative regulator of replication initiation